VPAARPLSESQFKSKHRRDADAPPVAPPVPLTEVQRRAARLRRQESAPVEIGEPPAAQLNRLQFDRVTIKDPDSPTPRVARRALSSRNLERWLARSVIDEAGYRAGDRYRSSYERAGFEQRVTSRYDIVTAGGQAGNWRTPGPQNDAQMDAWMAWRAAREDLGSLAGGFDQLILHDSLMDEIDAHNADGEPVWLRRGWVMLGVGICIKRLKVFYRL
jgi:hypothetical protein